MKSTTRHFDCILTPLKNDVIRRQVVIKPVKILPSTICSLAFKSVLCKHQKRILLNDASCERLNLTKVNTSFSKVLSIEVNYTNVIRMSFCWVDSSSKECNLSKCNLFFLSNFIAFKNSRNCICSVVEFIDLNLKALLLPLVPPLLQSFNTWFIARCKQL